MIQVVIEVKGSTDPLALWEPIGEWNTMNGVLPKKTALDDSTLLSYLSCGSTDIDYYDVSKLPVHHSSPRGVPKDCSPTVKHDYGDFIYDYITQEELASLELNKLSVPFKCYIYPEALQCYNDSKETDFIYYPNEYYSKDIKYGVPKGTVLGEWEIPYQIVEPDVMGILYSLVRLYVDYRLLWWFE